MDFRTPRNIGKTTFLPNLVISILKRENSNDMHNQLATITTSLLSLKESMGGNNWTLAFFILDFSLPGEVYIQLHKKMGKDTVIVSTNKNAFEIDRVWQKEVVEVENLLAYLLALYCN